MRNATCNLLGLTLIALGATSPAHAAGANGKPNKATVDTAFPAFAADEPAEQIAPEGQVVVTDALAPVASLPLQISIEGDEPLPLRQIPTRAPAGKGAKRSFKAGACQIELATGGLAVSTHELYPDGRFYVTQDSLLRGATIRGAPAIFTYLSVVTELTPRVLGDAVAQQACKTRLQKGPLALGRATLDGTRLTGVSASGTKPMTIAKAGDAAARAIYLVWDKTLGRAAVRDNDGMLALIESPVFSARGEEAGHYELNIEAAFALLP